MLFPNNFLESPRSKVKNLSLTSLLHPSFIVPKPLRGAGGAGALLHKENMGRVRKAVPRRMRSHTFKAPKAILTDNQ